MSLKHTSLDVLICTHNRRGLLKKTIYFLNNAKRPNHFSISLLVIANACTDDTIEFLENYQSHASLESLSLKWFEEAKPGKSNALNTALQHLEADIIALVDDDHRIDDEYFMAIESTMLKYPNADFFCGRIIPDWNGTEPAWVHDQGKYRIYPLPVPRFDLGQQCIQLTRKIAVPGGGNLVVKKALIEKIGEFSIDLGPVGNNLGGAEDTEWVIRAYNSGACLIYNPEITQYHYVDTARLTILYIVKKAYERSASVVRLSDEAKSFAGLLPIYLIRKVIFYFANFIFSLHNDKRRFYLVRTAATLGEMKGFILAKRDLS